MQIKSLEIKSFRHVKDQVIEFGDYLTVISGQNSTGKSSMLGWVAQSCKFKGIEKTINNKVYQAKYSDIFRFCSENDHDKQYEVVLNYQEENDLKTKTMKTRYLRETEKGKERYRIDYDGRSKAINYPVIYLGLKRLIPLATEEKIETKELKLNDREIEEFSNLSKEILILLDNNIGARQIKSKNKEFLAMETENYGHLGNSAGQDNIGQILTAMLSLKRLNKKGILLIDEIDATLYAGSQINLVHYLYNFSKNHKIQIIFTTHSLEILEYLSNKFSPVKLEKQIEKPVVINFLKLEDNYVKNEINPCIRDLKDKIKVQTSQTEKVKKVDFLCEDNLAKIWCKNLISGTNFKDKVEIMELGNKFGYGDLVKMAESKHPFFKEIKFIIDGDMKEKYKNKKLPRTTFLPCNDMPEKVFYSFLWNLSDADDFWQNENNFTKQVCFNTFQNANNKDDFKRWFNTNKEHFGKKNCSKLFNKWKEKNPEETKAFQESLKKIVYSVWLLI